MIVKKTTILLSVVYLNIYSCYCSTACKPKIAVIGAGIGGASASHFLSELFHKNLDIDIFESKTIGGRLATIKLGDEEFEAGGSIIHPRNKYMKDFVKILNLHPRPPSNSRVGIWNGKEYPFIESNWQIVTLLKLLYRYGLQPFYLHRYVSKILADFENIYDIQDKGVSFDNTIALLSAMNKEFVNLLKIPIRDHLINLGYETQLIDELVKSTIVVNYGQDVNIQAFVSCVSIAGAGFDLWSVKDGNKKVPEHLISNNERASVIYSTVKRIHRSFNKNMPKYEVFYKNKGEQNLSSRIYDIIIIAGPMTSDQETLITFDGFNDTEFQFVGEYQTTVATFVSGKINDSYFGMQEKLDGILSCNPIATKISSIGRLGSVEGKQDDKTQVWKIFSKQKLDNSTINKMFTSVDEIKEIDWKAYPHYSANIRYDKFKLDDLMYYVNAIEWLASAMEMSVISGRNAAILAFNDFQKYCSISNEKIQPTIHSEL